MTKPTERALHNSDNSCTLLQVYHLSIGFRRYDENVSRFSTAQHVVNVINDFNLSVNAGEIIALVGASGSGKTLLAYALVGIFNHTALVTGEIIFEGKRMNADLFAQTRGRAISLIPQGVNHLNPLMKVGRQVEGARLPRFKFPRTKTAKTTQDASQANRTKKRQELFKRYGLTSEEAHYYPHELSGGMARRILLCTALIDNPKLIIADEPTPGLDLSLAVTALADFRTFANAGGAVMLITHDIELALNVADRIAVFKDGTIVEETSVSNFAKPTTLNHPFSRALWYAMPNHGFSASGSQLGE